MWYEVYTLGLKFRMGDRVRKKTGSSWEGRIVGFYSTTLTAVGYAVESSAHPGSVQIYPEAALELVEESKNAGELPRTTVHRLP